ncbi:MAG: lysine--tRNA ligase [Candidatus Aenigmarchaeota archaeon]|nr:lysine--tRNA ligase [Candidatus Aenigmarchaeota archaeon]
MAAKQTKKKQPAKKQEAPKHDESPEHSLFWADQIAEKVRERCEKEPKLNAIVKKKGYLVYDEKTPSGVIHVGSGRGWIIHDVIAKAMRDAGMKGRFVLSSDDIDPFDRMNKGLPAGYEKYLGMPFRNIPSPAEGYKSFADYYFRQAAGKFKEFGIEAKIESTGEQYDKGVFNAAIKTVLDNANRIHEIYMKAYGKADSGKLPFNPICEKCGKIGTTRAYAWDPERQIVKYRCEPNFVEWAKGCGHEGEKSPYNGGGKLPWKVEWAAKWVSKGVVCELAGKDHFTKGGSRTIAMAISDKIFDFPPPYPSTRDSIGEGYEFFNIGGKKMSTSQGRGISFAESTKFAPAKMIRYMLVCTRPRAAIDFDPYRDNDVILLYDRYDRTERIYFGKEKAEGHEVENMKRIYELSHIGKLPSHMPPQIPFTYAASTAQTEKDNKKRIEMLKASGHMDKNATKEDIAYVLDRLRLADDWAKNFASYQYRISLLDEPPKDGISPKMRSVLKSIAYELMENKTEEEVSETIWAAAKASGDAKVFFRSAYLALIGKEQGPKLAPFIMSIGKARVIRLLERL